MSRASLGRHVAVCVLSILLQTLSGCAIWHRPAWSMGDEVLGRTVQDFPSDTNFDDPEFLRLSCRGRYVGFPEKVVRRMYGTPKYVFTEKAAKLGGELYVDLRERLDHKLDVRVKQLYYEWVIGRHIFGWLRIRPNSGS
jgi:hypothetical protein